MTIQLRKSLARDYALNELYATSGQQSSPTKPSENKLYSNPRKHNFHFIPSHYSLCPDKSMLIEYNTKSKYELHYISPTYSRNLKTREKANIKYCIPQTKPTVGSQCNTQAGDITMPPAYCLSKVEQSIRFFTCFKVPFRDCFSARATSQEVMFTSLTEKLTYLNSIIYNYRPCSRWGLAPQPSTKGSPCFCAKMRPSMLGRKGILKVFNKCTYHAKATTTYSTTTQVHLSPNTKVRWGR